MRRVDALTDGVFAIAATLLVLEIKVPPADTDLFGALFAGWTSFAAYLVSFMYIGLTWIGDRNLTSRFARTDAVMLFYRLMFLAVVAFIPFPTAVLADRLASGHEVDRAAALYGATLLLLVVTVYPSIVHARRRPGLLRPGSDLDEFAGWSFGIGPLLYAGSIALAFIATPLALVLFAVVPVFYALAFAAGRFPVIEDD